jgi:hypothetical protein
MDRAHYRRTVPGRLNDINDIQKSDYGVGYHRNPYDRKDYGERHAEKPGGFIERVISQCIVCGIIMAVILIINLMDSSVSVSLRNSIVSAIRTQTTADDVKSVWQTAKNSIETIFGTPAKKTTENNLSEATAKVDTQNPSAQLEEIKKSEQSEQSTEQNSTETQTDTSAESIPLDEVKIDKKPDPPVISGAETTNDFRIDEDILSQIESNVTTP